MKNWRTTALTLLASATICTAAIAAETAEAPPMPQPTAEHELLAREVGTWDAKVTLWPTPDSEPELSTGVETNAMLGSMWLVSKFEGDMMGTPFVGQSTTGYDPTEKKYVGTWVDSISPYLTSMTGAFDARTQQLTMNTECRCFMTGEMRSGKMVSKVTSDDTRVLEMYGPDESGAEYLSMRIEYQRRK